jgi:hypothetical protein
MRFAEADLLAVAIISLTVIAAWFAVLALRRIAARLGLLTGTSGIRRYLSVRIT